MKNGSIETELDFSSNPNLTYICCDPEQLTAVYNQTLLNSQTNCAVNTTCDYSSTFLYGSIINDQNLNCGKDTFDLDLEKRIVKAEKIGYEPAFSISNDQGQYQMGLDTGREVIGSYDPNEKLAQPKGVYDKHFIYPGTDIEYQINFQNTGTDTAFTVVIRDTLSYGLDVATFRAGISSHAYQVDVSGYGVLKFTFDNILLPDSNINEAASHGFVRFRITPKDTLQLGSRVENRAGIYFDFNPPIITNTVFHTVDTGFMERKMVSAHGLPDAQNGRVFPNPVRAGGYLFFEDMSAAHRIVLMDPYGKVVLRGNDSHKIRIPDGLAGGVYFLEWRGGVGKLVVLE